MPIAKLRTLTVAAALLLAAALPAQETRVSAERQIERWTAERANAWYGQQPWLVGADYLPSDATNQLEMFQASTWNPALNDRELALAESAGMNTLRVFLQDRLWQADSAGFLARLDAFLALAAKHGIRPILVLFDSCWDPYPRLGPQHPPIPGVHNSGWVQSPGAEELRDPAAEPKLEAYVRGVVGHFHDDPRVLAWDIWNEPDNGNEAAYGTVELPDKTRYVNHLLPLAFGWARAEHPTQPLTSGVWQGNWTDPARESATTRIQLAESDILSFHDYGWPESFEARIHELQRLGRPLVCTEYMARGAGSTFDGDLPIALREHVGLLNWGLVAGRSQTYLPWDSWQRPYTLQPPVVWHHDVFRPSGEPYRAAEVALLRRLTGRGASSTPPQSPPAIAGH